MLNTLQQGGVGALAGLSGQQLYGQDSNAAQNAKEPAAPPQTLVSALSALDELTKRLAAISARAYELASMVGGPFPTRGDKAQGGDQPPQSAISRLHSLVSESHLRLSDIDGAVSAMARSLGAST